MSRMSLLSLSLSHSLSLSLTFSTVTHWDPVGVEQPLAVMIPFPLVPVGHFLQVDPEARNTGNTWKTRGNPITGFFLSFICNHPCTDISDGSE